MKSRDLEGDQFSALLPVSRHLAQIARRFRRHFGRGSPTFWVKLQMARLFLWHQNSGTHYVLAAAPIQPKPRQDLKLICLGSAGTKLSSFLFVAACSSLFNSGFSVEWKRRLNRCTHRTKLSSCLRITTIPPPLHPQDFLLVYSLLFKNVLLVDNALCVEYTERRPASNDFDSAFLHQVSAAGRLTPPLQTSSSELSLPSSTLLSSSPSRGAAKRRHSLDHTDRRPPSNRSTSRERRLAGKHPSRERAPHSFSPSAERDICESFFAARPRLLKARLKFGNLIFGPLASESYGDWGARCVKTEILQSPRNGSSRCAAYTFFLNDSLPTSSLDFRLHNSPKFKISPAKPPEFSCYPF
ncbi:hypothetical protein R3P38DRAFT_2765382 [Favolaschia claudopus]|uniref:Maturase K n=1 Tax=Favolaschia claudopus TaxID=2862362 RepID=A0AAW0D270_9AGAR